MAAALLALLLAPLLAALPGCGARGGPLPPFDPTPPPVESLSVAQRGYEAIVRFEEPRPEIREGRDTMDLDRIEILIRSELYPVIGPELLAEALDDELRRRVERAREAIEAARKEIEAQDEAGEGEAGDGEEAGAEDGEQDEGGESEGGEVTPDETQEQPVAPEDRLTAEERARQRIPDETRNRWREAGVGNDALATAGRQIEAAVSELWQRLELPETIVDPERPPALPPADRVLDAAGPIARSLDYERALPPEALRASPREILVIDMDEADAYRLGRAAGERARLGIRYPVGIPSDDRLRTRFFFGCRTVTARGTEGRLGDVVALAPAVVLLPPARVEAEVLPQGVRLTWRAPFADARGVVLIDEAPRFNVYRGRGDDPPSPTPLNSSPLQATTHLDGSAAWDTEYVYTVRALRPGHGGPASSSGSRESRRGEPSADAIDAAAGESGLRGVPSTDAETEAIVPPVKESGPARTTPVSVVDTFPPGPPTDLRIDRAGAQVTLRWTASASGDVIGYRIYRHPLPAPAIQPPSDEGEAAEETVEAEGSDDREAAEPETGDSERTPGAEETQEDAPGDPYVAAGWRSLVEPPVTEVRFVDDEIDPDTGYAYLVLAVDRNGNPSEPARAESPAGGDDR